MRAAQHRARAIKMKHEIRQDCGQAIKIGAGRIARVSAQLLQADKAAAHNGAIADAKAEKEDRGRQTKSVPSAKEGADECRRQRGHSGRAYERNAAGDHGFQRRGHKQRASNARNAGRRQRDRQHKANEARNAKACGANEITRAGDYEDAGQRNERENKGDRINARRRADKGKVKRSASQRGHGQSELARDEQGMAFAIQRIGCAIMRHPLRHLPKTQKHLHASTLRKHPRRFP